MWPQPFVACLWSAWSVNITAQLLFSTSDSRCACVCTCDCRVCKMFICSDVYRTVGVAQFPRQRTTTLSVVTITWAKSGWLVCYGSILSLPVLIFPWHWLNGSLFDKGFSVFLRVREWSRSNACWLPPRQEFWVVYFWILNCTTGLQLVTVWPLFVMEAHVCVNRTIRLNIFLRFLVTGLHFSHTHTPNTAPTSRPDLLVLGGSDCDVGNRIFRLKQMARPTLVLGIGLISRGI